VIDMARLLMVAGGMVEPGGALPGSVSAYVVLSTRVGRARVFKVSGALDTPRVDELPKDTAVDVADFQGQLHRDLDPVVRAVKNRGGTAGVSTPADAWVCDLVQAHLVATEVDQHDD